MTQSLLGKILVPMYSRVPLKRHLLNIIVRLEGGQMVSATLRAVLSQHYGVELGHHSYGSLAEPGRADRGTVVGRYVSIGPDVRRFGASHPLDKPSMHPYWYNAALGHAGQDDDVPRSRCEIGHDSWIGAGATILPGCTRIGIGAVVGAASVVVRDVPDFAVVVGNPARVVRYRLTPEERRALAALAPWTLEPFAAKDALANFSTSDTV